ncbi:nuclease-related domain-containing protein [Flavobacterium hauense]
MNNNVNDFKSIKEVIKFQKDYSNLRLELISNHSRLIEKEEASLEIEMPQLEAFIELKRKDIEQELLLEIDLLKQRFEILSSIQSNAFKAFCNYFRKRSVEKKIKFREFNFSFEVTSSVQPSQNKLNEMKSRYQFIASHFNEAVKESGKYELIELERKRNVIDKVNSSIYGAIGEQKVLKVLEELSDDYIVINDFRCSFNPAIYNSKTRDYIKSIQVDHLLISPVGVFIIETKNWSEDSMNNLSLRSPVEQIVRANFALYNILNTRISKSLDLHHWGQKKIPIKNLIVLINRKPKEEFQHVKVLTLNELQNYVAYFQPIFSQREVKNIASNLLDISY